MDIIEVKSKLTSALERLELTINHKVNTLMLENSSLKTEVLNLQKELKKINILYNFKDLDSTSSKNNDKNNSKHNFNSEINSQLVTPSVANDIDLSLAKLKKLVS